jgi:5-dehydro-4-deoxyglucarate dehydratase
MIKAGMKVIGRDSGHVRPPLTDLTLAETEELTTLIERLETCEFANRELAAA